MSEPRGSDASKITHNDAHDLEALAESSAEVAHLAALDHYTGVCEWTVSGVMWFIYSATCLTVSTQQSF